MKIETFKESDINEAHHGFEKTAGFKSDEWKNDSNDYLTFIYRKKI